MTNIFNLQSGFSKWLIVALFAVLLSTISLGNEASAQPREDVKVEDVICNAVQELTGPIGRAIAVLIVISLAIALFLGKVTWGLAIAVAVGLGVLFGAPTVVALLSGQKVEDICK